MRKPFGRIAFVSVRIPSGYVSICFYFPDSSNK
jgi:hypothetical protein